MKTAKHLNCYITQLLLSWSQQVFYLFIFHIWNSHQFHLKKLLLLSVSQNVIFLINFLPKAYFNQGLAIELIKAVLNSTPKLFIWMFRVSHAWYICNICSRKLSENHYQVPEHPRQSRRELLDFFAYGSILQSIPGSLWKICCCITEGNTSSSIPYICHL